MAPQFQPRLPAAPYLDLFNGRAPVSDFPRDSSQRRLFYEALRTGEVTFRQADLLANHLGMHPCEIWGEDWWAA